MSGPSVFISYSHKDEEWKNRLVIHLGVLAQEGILDAWDDRRIEAGDDWKPEIENAINKAAVAILMISANFLTSKFILGEEVPKLLKRRTDEGVRVIPLIVKPCAWTQVKWLSPIQARPKDGKPLSGGNDHQIDTDLATLAEEIAKLIKRAEAKTSEVLKTSEVWKIPPEKVSLAKLPSTSPDLFGRETKLQQLDDAWNDQNINVLSLVAWGGVGKTALVNKWLSNLAKDNYHGAARVYGWSFYSQGAREGAQNSADQFIAAALEWFGDPDSTAGSPWDKGERLAELIKKQRTLLILDGLEPLQNPPPVETGKIKDPGLTSLLRELGRQNPGLVVISTRLAVDDLKDFIGSTALEIDLETLSPDAGAAYLEFLGVNGTEDERKEASHDFGGHALALTLLGRYLKVVHGGDIRKRKEIPHVMDEQKQGAHARRVMKSYEVFLKGKPELDILRLMGLFDRPAESGAMEALREEPAIKDLTENIQKLSEVEWKYAVENLQELRLLARPSTALVAENAPHSAQDEKLDCHPLLREHFDEKLRTGNPEAWRKGHSRLFEYYSLVAKVFPRTIEEMAPLYAAATHGCQAGRHRETFNDVYWRRIQRGRTLFNSKILGAIGADLAVLSFFFDSLWHKPVDELSEINKVLVLNFVGAELRALGRMADAVQPMQIGLKSRIALRDWGGAAIDSNNLSELYLTLGDIRQALAYAEQNAQFANKNGDKFNQMRNRTLVANIQHQAGNLAEAQTMFNEAEKIIEERRSNKPSLPALPCFQYCDLLLSQGKYAEVEQRARLTLRWYEMYTATSLLDIALCNLSLGRVLLSSPTIPHQTGLEDTLTYLNCAVNGLRRGARQDYLPHGLLTRAAYYRVIGDLDKSQNDLDEAFSIASRGGMGLYLADCHLEYARLALANRGPKTEDGREKARKHLKTAKEMIEKMGYHKRDKEVEELEETLSS